MTAGLTAFVSLIYVAIAVGHVRDGQPGLALAFASYAAANVGLIMAARG